MKTSLLTALLVGMAVANGPPADNENVPDYANRSDEAKAAAEAGEPGKPDFAGKPDGAGESDEAHKRKGGDRRLADKTAAEKKRKKDALRRLAADNDKVPSQADRSEDAKTASEGKGKSDFAGKPDGAGKSDEAGKPDSPGKSDDAGKPDGGDRRLDGERRLDDHSDDTKYACCKFEQDLVGTILFEQRHADSDLQVFGVLRIDKDELDFIDGKNYESRSLGIADAEARTCAVSSVWPFDDADQDEHCALDAVRFNQYGAAIYRTGSSPATLFGDQSVIKRSVALYEDETVVDKTMGIDACCTIEEMTEEQFVEAYASYQSDFEAAIKEKHEEKEKKEKSAKGGK